LGLHSGFGFRVSDFRLGVFCLASPGLLSSLPMSEPFNINEAIEDLKARISSIRDSL
jgi:hypothetical protein